MARSYSEAENREVADLVAGLRNARNLTQAELCTQAGLSLLTVNRLERGEHVRANTMKRIIEALGRFERVPRSTAERICAIYGFSPSIIDAAALSHGPGTDAIGARTSKELHLLLDRAINATGLLAGPASTAALFTIEAMLSALAGESQPRTTQLAMRHPPQRVGDYEVEVVEPAQDDRRKSG